MASYAIPIHGKISVETGWCANAIFVLGVSGDADQDRVRRAGEGIARGVPVQFTAELATDVSHRV
jgi:hypothetical protein